MQPMPIPMEGTDSSPPSAGYEHVPTPVEESNPLDMLFVAIYAQERITEAESHRISEEAPTLATVAFDPTGCCQDEAAGSVVGPL
ncbi:hypothetical protein L6452_43863 [Arctium lappa]|uniref:Uncharacterized protein n=1 Tax=Arctium lappa TaxID=4217 RepID=A0ACB8XEG4_ARCLA|nr:hypothetical protein L6452_43863 [Arctium lappa]